MAKSFQTTVKSLPHTLNTQNADYRIHTRSSLSYSVYLDNETEKLKLLRDTEQKYLENVPENFQSSESFEDGECAVDALDEIIDMLVEVYRVYP